MIYKMDFAKYQARKQKRQKNMEEIAWCVAGYTACCATTWYFFIQLSGGF
jgi:hypothetical protein